MVETSSLLASLFVSSIGMGIFVYGKKQGRFPQLAVGLTMMAYTYFISSVPIILAIATALVALLWLAVRMGY